MERLDLSHKYNPIEAAIHEVRYLPFKRLASDASILDIACGEGFGTQLLSRWGAKKVVGVDISSAAISAATALLGPESKDNISFHCDDACNFLENCKTQFDAIISVETIEHVADPERFLKLLKKVLKPNGTIGISCPNDQYYYGHGVTLNQYHRRSFSFSEFSELSESILGPGTWFLGAPATGFNLFPMSRLGVPVRNYLHALGQRVNIVGETLPAPNQGSPSLDEKSAIFFMGLWGKNIQQTSNAVTIPFQSDFRLGPLRSAPPDISRGRIRRLGMVAGSAWNVGIERLRQQLAGSFDIHQVQPSPPETLAERLISAGPLQNIHFLSGGDAIAFAQQTQAVVEQGGESSDALAILWTRAVISVELPNETSANYNFADILAVPHNVMKLRSDLPYVRQPVLWQSDIGSDADRKDNEPSQGLVVGVAAEDKWTYSLTEDGILPALKHLYGSEHSIRINEFHRDDWAVPEKRDHFLGDITILLSATTSPLGQTLIEEAIAAGVPVLGQSGSMSGNLLQLTTPDAALDMTNPESAAVAIEIASNGDRRSALHISNLSAARRLGSIENSLSWMRMWAKAQENHAVVGRRLRQAQIFHWAELGRIKARSRN